MSRPRDEQILARQAAVAQLRHRPEEFAAVVAEVEKFNPKPATFFTEVASALEERRLYDDAEIYFKKAIDLRDKLAAPRARPGHALPAHGQGAGSPRPVGEGLPVRQV